MKPLAAEGRRISVETTQTQRRLIEAQPRANYQI